MGTTAEKLQAILDAKTAIKTVINQNSASKVGDDLSTYATVVSGIRSSLINFIQGGSNIIITAEDLNGATAISDYMFTGCTGLISISIPDTVISIGEETFMQCSGLTSLTIGNGVTNIGYRAFRACSGLPSVSISNSVTSIGRESFFDCSGLISVMIGNGVTNIGDDAFWNCSGLTSVHITDIIGWCRIEFDSYASNPLTYAHNLYLNNTLLTELTIPDSVTAIKTYAFNGCSGLTSLTIGNSITSIGFMSFHNCTGLNSISIGNGVTSIGCQAFSNCSGLSSITLTALTPPQLGSGVFNSTNNCPIYVLSLIHI